MVLPVTFIDQLKVASASFTPSYGQEYSGQANGAIRVRELRAMLWRATLKTADLSHDDALDLQALFLQLDGSNSTFYCYDPRRSGPRNDPAGTILGASTVQIHTVGGDNKSLRLKGLPAGYVLDRDYLSFDYGPASPGPQSRALHQMIEGPVVADGSGITPSFEIRPHLREGAVADLEVTLVKPSAEMRLLPGSYQQSTSGLFTQLSFDAIQEIWA